MKNKLPIYRLDAHHKLFISIAMAALCFVATIGRCSGSVHFMITWLVYATVTLTLSALTIFNVHPYDMHREAHLQDSSRTLIFVFAVFASLASLFAILILLRSSPAAGKGQLTTHVLLSLACVFTSWILVHTIFTFRYANFYYSGMDKDPGNKNSTKGGLQFPGENQPDYIDFSYFSFVIGMTFQVSDVSITSKKIRRLVLMHGLLAFAFNTIIVALSINVIAGLMQNK